MTRRETYRTGELARAAGVSADTIRHYERMGVLPTAPRGRNGYRSFPHAALQRIAVIQRALEAGFSLADLRRVLRIRDAGGAPCRQVYAIAEQRLGELEDRIRDLQALRDELAWALAEWRDTLASTPSGTRAGLLDSWAARLSERPPRWRSPGRLRKLRHRAASDNVSR
jgi:DNA-binding transcriptional MerR regulator